MPAHNEPGTDEDELDNSMSGFTESRGDITNTNHALGKRRRAIPMAAQSWGIQRTHWARTWLRLRKKQKLNATIDGTLMPACGPDWQLVPGTRMTSDTLSLIVRDISQQGGLNPNEARTFTVHIITRNKFDTAVAPHSSRALSCGLRQSRCQAEHPTT